MDLDPSGPSASAPRPSVFSTSSCCTACTPRARPTRHKRSTPTAATSTAWPRGREPGLMLEHMSGEGAACRIGAVRLLDACEVQAAALDAAHASTAYRAALETHASAWPTLTSHPRPHPAAMGPQFEGSYVRFIRRRSDQTLADLMALPFTEKQRARYEGHGSIPCWSRPASKPATPGPSRAFGGAIWIRRPPRSERRSQPNSAPTRLRASAPPAPPDGSPRPRHRPAWM